MHFIESSLHSYQLSGTLRIAPPPSSGRLLVDKKHYPFVDGESLMLDVPYGMHSIQWENDQKRVIWRERIMLLPFQVKGITLPQPLEKQ